MAAWNKQAALTPGWDACTGAVSRFEPCECEAAPACPPCAIAGIAIAGCAIAAVTDCSTEPCFDYKWGGCVGF